MKSSLKIFLVLAVFCLGVTVLTLGKDKRGPVSGTWACVAHGSDRGDINYTYNLVQLEEKVTGNFSDNSDGGPKADIKDGVYKDKKLSFTFDAYDGTVTVTGAIAKAGGLSGAWKHYGGGEGTWECTKGAPKAAAK